MTAERGGNDPVQVTAMWQASCDDCGWHTPPATPEGVVREWARLHRVTCPLKKPSELGHCLDVHPIGGWSCHEPAGHDGCHWSDGPGSAAW